MDIRSFFAKPKGGAAPSEPAKRTADDVPGNPHSAKKESKKESGAALAAATAAKSVISPADFFSLPAGKAPASAAPRPPLRP